MLLAHGYTPGIIDAAIAKARAIPGKRLLDKSPGTQTTRDLNLWSLMIQGSLNFIYTSEALEVYGVIRSILKISISLPSSYSKETTENIRESLIKAKVYSQNARDKRYIPGMKKGGKCLIFNYIKEGKFILRQSFIWKIVKSLSYNSFNVVYMIDSQKERCT